MADSSSRDDLLDRASKVFSLAGQLGRAFSEESQAREAQIDSAPESRYAAKFNEFCDALLDLREILQNPSDEFAPVVEQLVQAAKIAREIRDTDKQAGAVPVWQQWAVTLSTLCEAGSEAIRDVTTAQQLKDPFEFLDEPALAYSMLNQFPATPEGHVAFIELINDDISEMAAAKRKRAITGHCDEVLEQKLGQIELPEARARLSALSILPAGVKEDVNVLLRRRITLETVEEIDRLLTPAVSRLRASLKKTRLEAVVNQYLIINTVGDLLKAYIEGKKPCFESPGIMIQPGVNTPIITCTDAPGEAKRTSLDRAEALVVAEGGEKGAAMEKLIARVQLQLGIDNASVINMPLGDFVQAVMGHSGSGAARSPAHAQVTNPQLAATSVMEVESSKSFALAPKAPAKMRSKRSTERGEGRKKLIAALTTHHQYDNGSCLNWEPIGNNELAKMAKVSPSTASVFFNAEFSDGKKGGHKKYMATCSDGQQLIAALKLLNQEYSPYHLYGTVPPGEGERDVEE